jgi:hypothetical protein
MTYSPPPPWMEMFKRGDNRNCFRKLYISSLVASQDFVGVGLLLFVGNL